MKIQLLSLLLILGVFTACNSGNTNAQDAAKGAETEAEKAAWDAMMKVHDDVMPKMADINRTSRALKPYLEEGALEDKSMLEEVNRALKQLETADEGMMSWMSELKNLKTLRKEMDHAAVMEYLKAEGETITKVQNDMLTSLENGQKVLAKITGNEE
jgi:hypothetical protein